MLYVVKHVSLSIIERSIKTLKQIDSISFISSYEEEMQKQLENESVER